jgi:hypothetical protein
LGKLVVTGGWAAGFSQSRAMFATLTKLTAKCAKIAKSKNINANSPNEANYAKKFVLHLYWRAAQVFVQFALKSDPAPEI